MLVYTTSAALALIFSYGTALYQGASQYDKRGQRDQCGTKSSRVLWFLCWLALALPAMLRYNVGVDYSRFQGYEQLYQIYGQGQTIPEGMDVGFVFLIKLLWPLSHDAQLLFAVTSALSLALIVRAIARYTELQGSSHARWMAPTMVALFLVSGFYFESLNIIRQWIAIGCGLNAALEMLPPKAPRTAARQLRFLPAIKFCAWVLVGSLFHLSALAYLVLMPLSYVHLRPKHFAAVFIASVFLCFAGRPLMALLLEGTRFARYLGNSGGAYAKADPHFDSMLTTGCTFCGVLLLNHLARAARVPSTAASTSTASVSAHADKNKTFEALLCWALLISCSLAVSSLFLPTIVDRVVRLFFPFMLFALPDGLKTIPGGRVRLAVVLIVCALWLSMSGLRLLYGGQYGVLPYQSFLW